jgi:hypothetical protein
MTELGWTNWLRFGIWLIAGSVIYFMYGFKHSRLRNPGANAGDKPKDQPEVQL